ncbi:MAG: EamA family transporter [Thermoleophilaceae bacterium]
MSGGALALALGAALLHAAWNVLLAGSRDTVAATGGLLLWGVVLLAPAAALTGDVSASAAPYIAASAALEVAYFALLARAYRGGEVGVVYPVARGSAPVLVLAVGALALGERPAALAVAGVLGVAAGVLLLVRHEQVRLFLAIPAKVEPNGARRDLLLGAAIGATIAGYTLVDSEGLDHADPIPYLFLITAAVSAAYCGGLLAGGRGAELKAAALQARTPATAAATFGAYAMVLAALELAPAAPVAAVRESSVIIAALLAALFLKEPLRLAPALLVAAGVAAIGLA